MDQEFDLDHIFDYHAPDDAKQGRHQFLRNAAKNFAKCLLAVTPAGADQSAALRQLRECVMTANAAIALDGRLMKPTSHIKKQKPSWDEGIKEWPKGWWLGEGLPCTRQRHPSSQGGDIEFPSPMYFTGERQDVLCAFCAKTILDLEPPPTNRLERRPA